MVLELVYNTDDEDVRRQMDELARQIEAMPVVRSLGQLSSSAAKDGGFQATLWCHGGKSEGSCGKRLEPPVHITQTRTTLLGCLTELRNRLETRHEKCIPAAEAARSAAAASAAGSGSNTTESNAFARLQAAQQLEAANRRADALNVQALAAVKEAEAAAAKVAELHSPRCRCAHSLTWGWSCSPRGSGRYQVCVAFGDG